MDFKQKKNNDLFQTIREPYKIRDGYKFDLHYKREYRDPNLKVVHKSFKIK